MEKLKVDINRIAAGYVLGTIAPGAIPQFAVEALEAGHDTPQLRILAGLDTRQVQEIHARFEKTLQELGLHLPTREDAVLQSARDIARSVLEGEISPSRAARRFWHDLYSPFGQPQELRGFVGYISESDSDPANRDAYSRLIIEECERLVHGNTAD